MSSSEPRKRSSAASTSADFVAPGRLAASANRAAMCFGEINANSGFHGMRLAETRRERPPLVLQTNHVSIGSFLIDMDERISCMLRRCNPELRFNLGLRISATPAPALDGAQEVFDLSIECRRLFQIDARGRCWGRSKGPHWEARISASGWFRGSATSSSPTASNTGIVIPER